MALRGRLNSSRIWLPAHSVRDRSFNFTSSIFHPGLRHGRDNGVGVQIAVGWESVSADVASALAAFAARLVCGPLFDQAALERCFLHEMSVRFAGIAVVAMDLEHHTGELVRVRESGRVPLKLFDLIEQGQDRCRVAGCQVVHVGIAASDVDMVLAYHSCTQYAAVRVPPAVRHLTLILVHHSHGPGIARSAISRSLFVSMFMLRILVNDDGD